MATAVALSPACAPPASEVASGCPASAPAQGGREGFQGTLVDAYVRPQPVSRAAVLACAFDGAAVERALLVAELDTTDAVALELQYRAAVGEHEARFLVALALADPAVRRLDEAGWERLVRDTGLFVRAVGGFPPPGGAEQPDHPDPWLGAVAVATARDLFVMPDTHGVPWEHVEGALRAAPDAKVLVLGEYPAVRWPQALRDHPNLFLVLDAATPFRRGDGVDVVADAWLPIVQAAPDRVMWASGASDEHDSDPAGYHRLVAYSRQVIDRLPRPLRVPFAAANARRVFGTASPPEADA